MNLVHLLPSNSSLKPRHPFPHHLHHLESQSSILSSSNCIPLIQSCSTKSHLLQIHGRLIRTSLILSAAVSTAFVTRAAASSPPSIDYARLVFSQVENPDIFHYNAMIKGFSQSKSPENAFHFYVHMRALGVNGNPFSASFVLKSCLTISSLSGAKQLHCRILRDGFQSDSLLLTSLMSVYASCGDGDDAQRVFDEMPVRDTIAWNVLISCFARNRRTKDALRLFDEMRKPSNGCEPDNVTCLLLLQACANLGVLEFGERIHRYIEECGYSSVLNTRNSLIAMYSRCGCVDKAYRVFCDTKERNVVTWSVMISGLAMNGHGSDAIEAFREMQRVGVEPDEQTFTGVLSACSHSGFVDEGLRFYDMMRFDYKLIPNVCHYGCIIDLLGRAGLLDRAYRLIASEMGVQPDATIWRTLLGACRIHGHVDLGERVIGHLIELKAQQAGDYVLLLNLYASSGNWEKVSEVRKLMKDKKIQTTPGCSTMELNGEIHEFIVDDSSHPQRVEIYAMLDEIGQQLKIAGYIANMESELHDLDDEGKGRALSCHSEKFAIAFGILSTPPGTTIRIAKNLRTCPDCHNFAKAVSSVYNRVVAIRDRSRFHHFREGRCSCNDYW